MLRYTNYTNVSRPTKLEAEERAQLEQRLQNDPDFAEQWRSYELMQQTLQHYGDRELDAQLSELGLQLMQEADSAPPVATLRPFWNRPLWLAAAAIVVLAVLSIVFWPRAERSPEQLFAAHFEAKAPGGERGSDADARWEQSLQQYSQGLYPEAIAGFEGLLADSSFSQPGPRPTLSGYQLSGAAAARRGDRGPGVRESRPVRKGRCQLVPRTRLSAKRRTPQSPGRSRNRS